MNDLRAAAQLALEFIEVTNKSSFFHLVPNSNLNKTITALRAAMAQPAPEPVAVVGTQLDVWRFYNGQWAPPGEPIKMAHMLKDLPVGTMLYTAPPQQAETLNLSDPAVRKRLAAQWGYVPAAPVEEKT